MHNFKLSHMSFNAMSQDLYSSLLLGANSIRLLRLVPNLNKEADIECTFFVYSLHDTGRGTHLYEALSYVWGDTDSYRSICANGHNLSVRRNLHTALLRLRDPALERIIWVDAICINQEDLVERGNQVQLMAMIYSKASKVVIWLGEAADNSDRALEEIVVAARRPTRTPNHKISQEAILKLLQRPWFRRIWVLQEVAAARNILIMCGPVEVDGYAFCLGLTSLELSYEAFPGLQNLIRSVIYLIREAILRPKYATSSSNNFSLDIRPLGELIDMYYTRGATDNLDKVYALLAMSTDNPVSAGLFPDYSILWEQLFRRLVEFVLCKYLYVKTWQDRNMAVIQSQGCVIGEIDSVDIDATWNYTQVVKVTSRNAEKHFHCPGEWEASWTLPTVEKAIKKGDIVCILLGVSKPMIIRKCMDHFMVIMIAATPMDIITGCDVPGNDSAVKWHMKWPDLIRAIRGFPRDFLLVWDLGESHEEYYSLTWIHSKIDVAQIVRLQDMEPIMKDLERHEEATWLRRAVESRMDYMIDTSHTKISSMDENIAIYRRERFWKATKKVSDQVATAQEKVKLAADNEEQVKDITKLSWNEMEDPLVIKNISRVVGNDPHEIHNMWLWPERIWHNIPLTEELVKAVVKNEFHGDEMIRLLFYRKRDQVPITEEVVKLAAGNEQRGYFIMVSLFAERGNQIPITEAVVKAAAGNGRIRTIGLFFHERGDGVPITEEVLKVVLRNKRCGKGLLNFLFEKRGMDVPVTKEIVELAAEHWETEFAKHLSLWRVSVSKYSGL